MKDKKLILVLGLFSAGLILLLLIAALSAGYQASRVSQPRNTTNTAAANQTAPAASPAASPQGQDFFLFDLLGGESPPAAEDNRPWWERVLEITSRLLLAVVLAAILAFRPRKDVPLFRRSLFVSQTQILLAVVAAALMMIVGDNAARAFAIFAAVSFVRFRTNIRDPKEITVLLISLALGLAAGVGRWELGISLCVFALVLLWLLERREPEQIYRSMELTVRTRNLEFTDAALRQVFAKMKLDAEMRQIQPPDEKKTIGSITYFLNLRLNLTTEDVSNQILAADPDNIDGIEWSKTKTGNIYQ